jgi:4-diphosphocytidyl-2-C-methyl-D-erythritol kinase
MTNTFTFYSPAKINLDLKVIDRKLDGYHLIESNFQILNFFDQIEVKRINSKNVNFRTNISSLNNSENIAFKAINAMDQYNKKEIGLDIFLKKKYQ